VSRISVGSSHSETHLGKFIRAYDFTERMTSDEGVHSDSTLVRGRGMAVHQVILLVIPVARLQDNGNPPLLRLLV
jgi:hypothetical protein